MHRERNGEMITMKENREGCCSTLREIDDGVLNLNRVKGGFFVGYTFLIFVQFITLFLTWFKMIFIWVSVILQNT